MPIALDGEHDSQTIHFDLTTWRYSQEGRRREGNPERVVAEPICPFDEEKLSVRHFAASGSENTADLGRDKGDGVEDAIRRKLWFVSILPSERVLDIKQHSSLVMLAKLPKLRGSTTPTIPPGNPQLTRRNPGQSCPINTKCYKPYMRSRRA
jgi:hypothetical protein